MSKLQLLTFAYPWVLFFLALLPLAYWLRRKRESRSPALAVPGLEQFAIPLSYKEKILRLLPLIRYLTLALLIIALARPQTTLRSQLIKGEGVDIALSMDLSSSMLAQDFTPNRLEVCKQLAREFVVKRSFDRFAVVVFAGESYTQCPLTGDHEVVDQLLADLECGQLEDGTAIGMGLATAVNRLKDSPVKSKVIILLTDGVNNAGYIQPLDAVELARNLSIKVYTIAVGSDGEALSPVGRRPDGKYIFDYTKVEIDEALLRKIAASTGGQSYRARSEADLQAIYAEIDRLEKSEVDVEVLKRYREEFLPFLLAAIILVILDLLIRLLWIKPLP